ncbi:MAG TPA: NAD(P)H-hydrate dehydratase [Spirochaetota bacterium]|nr:NAD(P)H-hydrate dehydratase [Spirochaetota bacterium]
MKVVTARQMQSIDRATIDSMGIPGVVLMAQAGRAVADRVLSLCSPCSSVAVICGTGNNGGDGFVVAYHLWNHGIQTTAYLLGESARLTPDARIFHDTCVRAEITVHVVSGEVHLADITLSEYDLIVDAMTGTGFSGPARGLLEAAIGAINECGVPVVSVDLPSGLSSDGEAPSGPAIRAQHTVTIGLPKISTVTHPCAAYCGELTIADIGFPRALIDTNDIRTELVDERFVRAHYRRPTDPDLHKGKAGSVLCIGGFDGMEGAIMMSIAAAFETGIGLATLLTTRSARASIAGRIPELMTMALPDDDGTSAVRSLEILPTNRKYSSALIGPGMGRDDYSARVFAAFMLQLPATSISSVVIDGDGLYHLADYLATHALPHGISFVVTPHVSEAARLAGSTVEAISSNRFETAMSLAAKTGAVAVLKGPSTISSDGHQALINTTGDYRLATAGSGDVLAGILVALLNAIEPLVAAGIAAYVHGTAADRFVRETGALSIKATDVISRIRTILSGSAQ